MARLNVSDMEYPQEFMDLIQPGKELKLFYGEGNINNQIVRIRAVVDEVQVVFCAREESVKIWVYQLGHIDGFWYKYRQGVLSENQ